MKRISFLTCVLITVSAALFAEKIQLTVEDAVSIAMKNNLDIKQAEKDLAGAQADLRAAYADLLMPSLQLNGSFSYVDPIQSAANPFNDSYSAGLGIQKNLFAGGKYWFAKESKRFLAELAEFKLKDMIKTVTRNTRANFYNLLLLKEKLRIAGENDKSLKGRMDFTSLNYQNGLSSEFEYLTAQVKYKNNQPVLLNAQNSYEIGIINFCNTIGCADTDSVEPVGDISDSMKLILKMTDEARIAEIALKNDLTLRSLDYTISVNEANKAVALAARYPSLTGSFSYGYNYKVTLPSTERAFASGWNLTLSLIIPIDPWLPVVSKLSNQTASLDEAIAKLKLQKEQAELGLRMKVKSLLTTIMLAEQSIAGQQENVKQAKLALDIANKQYREGSLSSLDLTDAELGYNQALANYLQALNDRYTNVLQLNDLLE